VAVQRPVPYDELLSVDALLAAGPPSEAELGRLKELARAGDAEAAFRVGLALLRRDPSQGEDEAAPWFAKGIEFGGSAWAWLATEAYDQDPRLFRAAVARAIAGDYPRADAPGIRVAPDTIEPVDADEWDMSPMSACFQVSEDGAAIRLALGRAAERLALVDERGREYASFDELAQLLYAPGGPRRPDGETLLTVGPTSLELDDPRGPYILTEVPETVPGPMMRTMIRIIVEELIDAGVTEAHLGPYRPSGRPTYFRHGDTHPWTPPAPA
jgi:hypothetical protein